MQYEENPIALLLIPLAVILGGGAVAAAVVMKKKKAPALPAGPSYPYEQMPSNVPTSRPAPKADPAQQIRQFKEKYGSLMPSAQTAAKTAWEALATGKPVAAKPDIAQMSSDEMSAFMEKRDKETGQKPTEHEMSIYFQKREEEGLGPEPQSPDDVNKASKTPGLKDLKKPLGVLGTAKTGASILGVGLGTIALVAGAAVIVVAGVESIRRQQRKQAKHKKQKKAFLTQAILYVHDTNKVNEQLAKLKAENDRIERGTKRLNAKLASLKGGLTKAEHIKKYGYAPGYKSA